MSNVWIPMSEEDYNTRKGSINLKTRREIDFTKFGINFNYELILLSDLGWSGFLGKELSYNIVKSIFADYLLNIKKGIEKIVGTKITGMDEVCLYESDCGRKLDLVINMYSKYTTSYYCIFRLRRDNLELCDVMLLEGDSEESINIFSKVKRFGINTFIRTLVRNLLSFCNGIKFTQIDKLIVNLLYESGEDLTGEGKLWNYQKRKDTTKYYGIVSRGTDVECLLVI